ncbi:MAG TPA: ParB/RepB/Spo0J family partition protein [Candidatus Aphodomonas merdavium]|nr:ParB/RepB/Spo0J family partition protein [Candidatus Aphodomonas merdavium]
MKNRGLGRGLDALMPQIPQDDGREQVKMLRMGDIDPNPEQPRRRFEAEPLAELAASIRQVGVLQPILVTEIEGRYRIIAGERRWRAARMAELSEIPAIVRPMDEIARMEAALIENIQREDLNPLEEALAVRALMEKCGLTQEKAAERLGRSRPALANLLRLLTLPQSVLELLRDGKLSAGHARALVAVEDDARRIALAQKAVREGWSVRQMEQAAQEEPPQRKAQRKAKRKLPEFVDMEERLRHAFGMKASIDGTLSKGKITLQYASRSELERLYDLLGGPQEND